MAGAKVAVIGMGYVGLPLAIGFAEHYSVVGYDIKQKRIDELKKGIDSNREFSQKDVLRRNIEYTTDERKISGADFVIVAVPTPVTESKKPDLSLVINASKTVGRNLKKCAVVVYESTVYPGVTEEICVPIIERESGLKCGRDFRIGYSPERINPGDREHRLGNIVKVVSGMDKDTTDRIAELYGRVVRAGVFRARNIKTAEAAKVIENIQRDLNIALMNELSLIFKKMGINTKDVLDAASTKWNFHRYHPGLVGGHCISVDPYYLTHRSRQLGYHPKVILAGRETNDSMAGYVADMAIEALKNAGKKLSESRVVLLGLTFKENVCDTRNSRARDVINRLKKFGINVIGCEPLIEESDRLDYFGVPNVRFDKIEKADAFVLINGHAEFRKIKLDDLKTKMDKPILIDVKNFFEREEAVRKGFVYLSL